MHVSKAGGIPRSPWLDRTLFSNYLTHFNPINVAFSLKVNASAQDHQFQCGQTKILMHLHHSETNRNFNLSSDIHGKHSNIYTQGRFLTNCQKFNKVNLLYFEHMGVVAVRNYSSLYYSVLKKKFLASIQLLHRQSLLLFLSTLYARVPSQFSA